nr:MAG TPA: hypothetical protein [Caudoviricetes sp.]
MQISASDSGSKQVICLDGLMYKPQAVLIILNTSSH